MTKQTLATIAATCAVLFASSGHGQSPAFLPLDQVRPGMKGIGKTVFYGSQVEEFGVEVVDVIRNYYPQQDLILVRLHGERVDYTGVVAGMSGSPVYLEGKLAGALALRVGSFAKEPLAGVTPIAQMFSLIDKEKDRHLEEAQVGSAWNPYLDLALSGAGQGRDTDSVWEEVASARASSSTLPVPVGFSGFRSEVVDYARERLARWGFVAVQGGMGSQRATPGPVNLQPGDAVSQVLIDGDMVIDVAGTVTWCQGDTVLAFGHQVFGVGAVRLPMGEARVLTTVPSLMGSDKVTAVSRIIGTIRQDRISGLFGIVGEEPPMVPVHIRYHSLNGSTQEYRFRVAVARQLDTVIPFYLRIAVLNALLTSRLGGGDVSLRAEGQIFLADGRRVALDNFFTGTRTAGFFSPSSDGVMAADDLAAMLASLMVNQFQEAAISRVEVEFSERAGFASAQIAAVWYDKTEVVPGDTVGITAVLRPFQSDKVVRVVRQVVIPRTVTANRVTIVLGGAAAVTAAERRQNPARFQPRSFGHLLKLLNERRRNDMLYLQLVSPEIGVMVGDAPMPNLPLSVLTVLNSNRLAQGAMLTGNVVYEEAIPVGMVVSGSRSLRVRVKGRAQP
ncbi:MAG: SpoIVB peptidase S55 domain-containing protein [bacterium]|nr:hypothetical protein [candidate division KSB1 bacterium]MDH7561001.1 SpoIVB peptidase S55 domain-containing protein [bacterium]